MKDLPAETRELIAIHAGYQTISSRRGSVYRVRYAWHKGIRFNSPLECECYKRLESLQTQGLIRYFLYQVSLKFPGGAKHIVNFMAVKPNAEPIWADAKEQVQSNGQKARANAKKFYGIDIQLWSEPPMVI